jgi:hypothetical protein
MAIPRTYFFTNGDASVTQLFILVTYGYTQNLFLSFVFERNERQNLLRHTPIYGIVSQ